MKKKFLKYFIIALMFMCAIVVYPQKQNRIDSLLQVINDKIKLEKYYEVEELLDSLKFLNEYQIDSVKLKVDLANALFCKIQNKDKMALEILLSGLTKIKDDKSSKYISDYSYEIGSIFSKTKNYPKAFIYFREVLKSAKYQKDSLRTGKGYMGLGSLHNHLFQDSSRGLVEELDSLNIKMHTDSLSYYYKKAIAILPLNEEGLIVKADVYSNLLIYNFYAGTYPQAVEYGLQSLKIHQKLKDSSGIARDYNLFGAISLGNKNFKEAINYYTNGLDIVNSRKDIKSINYKVSFQKNLGQSYKELNNYEKAYIYLTQAYYLKDSLDLVKDNIKYAEYEAKYNVTEKEKQTAIEKNKRKNAEMWLYIVSGTTTAILLFVWLFYRTQKIKREKKVLELQKEKLTKEREIEQLNNESQIKILNATIDAKETERQHISEILHNSVSTLLSSAGLHLQAAKISLKENPPEEIEKTQAIVKEAGDKIRDLSHTLISSVLMKFGLSYAIDDLCEKYSNSKLAFENESKNVQRYQTDFEIKIYSIIEELLNNVIKHSNATNAHILIKEKESNLEVRVFDDGDGFDSEKMKLNIDGGLGLAQITVRVKMMDGVFRIKSSKDIGTRVFMKVPIQA